jgi:hypothetical protein
MNEQLEKFALQAPLLKSYDYPDLRLVDDDQLERFAELIRSECCDFLKDTLDDQFAAEQLAEHFEFDN